MIRVTLFILMFFTVLFSSNFNISTSRPGSFSPTSSVGNNVNQLEIGLNYNSENNYLWLFNRLGIASDNEIQLTYYAESLSLGYMFGNIELDKRLFSSIILTTEFDKDNFEINNLSICIPLGYTIKENTSLNSHLNFHLFKNISFEDVQFSYALAVSHNINDKTSFFAEIYGTTLGLKENYFDFGFVYLTSNQLQYDISCGIMINDNFSSNSSYFIENGFSFYF